MWKTQNWKGSATKSHSEETLTGHICRMEDNRKLKTLMFGIVDGTNKRGRPCREWMDDIISWCKTGWVSEWGLQELNSLAQDRRRWKLITRQAMDTNGHWSHGSWRRSIALSVFSTSYVVQKLNNPRNLQHRWATANQQHGQLNVPFSKFCSSFTLNHPGKISHITWYANLCDREKTTILINFEVSRFRFTTSSLTRTKFSMWDIYTIYSHHHHRHHRAVCPTMDSAVPMSELHACQFCTRW